MKEGTEPLARPDKERHQRACWRRGRFVIFPNMSVVSVSGLAREQLGAAETLALEKFEAAESSVRPGTVACRNLWFS